jgi:hypothetical protein
MYTEKFMTIMLAVEEIHTHGAKRENIILQAYNHAPRLRITWVQGVREKDK